MNVLKETSQNYLNILQVKEVESGSPPKKKNNIRVTIRLRKSKEKKYNVFGFYLQRQAGRSQDLAPISQDVSRNLFSIRFLEKQ